ncbi:unnamed protein product [Allacma fusca]|uniref:Uncharacterized protein n=1 Tax=Allacma fusca TaxID=39272 RepID=A0A8J2PZ56_9HEXA|nr:unnamed protein product [Allacma fusca]
MKYLLRLNTFNLAENIKNTSTTTDLTLCACINMPINTTCRSDELLRKACTESFCKIFMYQTRAFVTVFKMSTELRS